MRRLILWLVTSGCLLSGTQSEDRVAFGVRISTEANSSVVGFIALKYSSDGMLRAKRVFTSPEEFIKVLAGFWPSPFNPGRINYFEYYQIPGGVYRDSITRKDYAYCPAFDSLWKIRFSDWPYNNRPLEAGWSLNRYRPSLKQEKYLCDRYNIKHLDFDYITDTSFWQLMRDVSDSAWIENYKFIQ